MESEWRSICFGDVVGFISEKSNVENANFHTYISTENMLPNFNGITTAKSLPSNGSATRFRINDTLFSNIRTYFKKVWQAKFDGLCSNDVLVFRSKDSTQLISNYLHHLCRWEKFTEFSIRTSKGAKMPRGDKAALAGFKFNLPSLSEQRIIAHILGTFDDKIELNQKMNKTLEAMAQALFKSWFVDFDPVRAKVDGRWRYGESLAGLPAHFYDLFPIDLVPTENLGDVPKDWQVVKLGDIADVLNGFAFKSKDYLSSGIFVLRTKNFSDNGYAERLNDDVFLSSEFLTSHKGYLCEEFDFFLVMVGASIGKVSTLFSTCLPALRNQNMWCFRPKKDFSSRFYINKAVTRIIQLNSQIASGSARDFFRKEDFKKFYIIKPSVSVLESFEKQVSSFYRRISLNHREINNLICLRDTLLPRLISGKLRIKDAEKIIGDAT